MKIDYHNETNEVKAILKTYKSLYQAAENQVDEAYKKVFELEKEYEKDKNEYIGKKLDKAYTDYDIVRRYKDRTLKKVLALDKIFNLLNEVSILAKDINF